MTVPEVLRRAESAVGRGTRYALGAGAPWTAPSPANEHGACDCSGFIAWLFGFARYQPTFGWLVTLNGGWMNTDGIVEDARQSTGLWEPDVPRPGSCLVYPSASYARLRLGSKPCPKIGHIGVCTSVGDDGHPLVIHCSAGNFRSKGDAIQETRHDVFASVVYTRAVRFAGLS